MYQTHKAIGILGGTFDPIHMGHLRMALELYEVLDLAKVHIVPCYQPVHRKFPAASPEQRFAMVECAVANEPALYADPREIRRKNPSYTIDTLLELRLALMLF
jgi:nicotinate-nucleotide adenylyltransferase